MAEPLVGLRDLFDNDFRHYLRQRTSPFVLRGPAGTFQVPWYFADDFDSASRVFVAYVGPGVDPVGVCRVVLEQVGPMMLQIDRGALVVSAQAGEPGSTSSLDLTFTKRVLFYVDGLAGDAAAEAVIADGRTAGFLVTLRGLTYADRVNRNPKCFISYDSRDRDGVAEPLARSLVKLGVPVWFDRFALRIGDRVREKIEDGLRRCRKCVFVLSKNFLANTGWPREEFDGVFDRERTERTDLILPVWCGVSREEVAGYCLSLGNRQAVLWEIGCDAVAAQIAAVVDPRVTR